MKLFRRTDSFEIVHSWSAIINKYLYRTKRMKKKKTKNKKKINQRTSNNRDFCCLKRTAFHLESAECRVCGKWKVMSFQQNYKRFFICKNRNLVGDFVFFYFFARFRHDIHNLIIVFDQSKIQYNVHLLFQWIFVLYE